MMIHQKMQTKWRLILQREIVLLNIFNRKLRAGGG
jgi:hypothetical protein